MTANTINTDKNVLLDEVRSVLNNAEELIASAGDEGTDKSRELRSKLSANLKLAKSRLIDAEKNAKVKAQAAARVTDLYVHENPWKSIGLAAGIAFLLGLLISRR